MGEAMLRAAIGIVATAIGVVVVAAAARATTPTPTHRASRGWVVTGTVYDASIGRNAPLAGVEVQYNAGRCCGPEGFLTEGSVYTDAAGAYRFEVPLEATGFTMRVLADGFLIFLASYETRDLPLATTIDVALQPMVTTTQTFTGFVYDASVSSTAAIA